MKKFSKDDELALEALRRAVATALEHKRRLGQYVVVWRDGRPQRIVPDRQDAAYIDSLSGERSASEVRETDKEDPGKPDNST